MLNRRGLSKFPLYHIKYLLGRSRTSFELYWKICGKYSAVPLFAWVYRPCLARWHRKKKNWSWVCHTAGGMGVAVNFPVCQGDLLLESTIICHKLCPDSSNLDKIIAIISEYVRSILNIYANTE